MKKVDKVDPFALGALRLDQTYSDGLAVKKLLTTIRVHKPRKQHFVQVHPSPDYQIDPIAVITLEDEDESYLVAPGLAAELDGEFKSVALFTTITRNGTLFLWPVPVAGQDGRLNPWHRSALLAVAEARKSWVRVVANREAGAYDISQAASNIKAPEWPDMPFEEMIKIAFRGRLIDQPDHPVIQKLRGKF